MGEGARRRSPRPKSLGTKGDVIMLNGLNTYVISYKDYAGEPATTEAMADTSYEAINNFRAANITAKDVTVRLKRSDVPKISDLFRKEAI